MSELETQKEKLLTMLTNFKAEKEIVDTRLANISNEIQEKIELHNQLISTISSIKKEYKEKLQKFLIFKELLKEQKKLIRKELEIEYEKSISKAVNDLNSLNFDFKLSIFRSFDNIQAINIYFQSCPAKKLHFIIFTKTN